jgi:hypothetical protein
VAGRPPGRGGGGGVQGDIEQGISIFTGDRSKSEAVLSSEKNRGNLVSSGFVLTQRGEFKEFFQHFQGFYIFRNGDYGSDTLWLYSVQ